MTDQELLAKCLQAFISLKSADQSNSFLNKHEHPRKFRPGSGQFKVRAHMIAELEQHLEKAGFPA
jgi:hypothetical protein